MRTGVLAALGIGLALLAASPGCKTTTASDSAPAPDAAADGGILRAKLSPEAHAAIDAIVAPYVDPEGSEGKAVGIAVGVFGPGVEDVIGYGATVRGGSAAPKADTIFEIGSLTKVFTGLLLARGVVTGTMSLEDPVQRFLPQGARVPELDGKPIVLGDLAAHMSGLPNFPDNMIGQPPNPAAGYTPELLYAFLAGHTLTTVPGTSYRYSNLGSGLLGFALAAHANGVSYEALIGDLLRPLGMTDTRIAVPEGASARRAEGHMGARVVPPNQIDTLEGGGALRSTPGDLLAFIKASVGASPSELDDAFGLLQQKRVVTNEGKDDFGTEKAIGLGLDIRSDGTRTWFVKSGLTAGFTTFLAMTRDPPAGVIVLANTGNLSAVSGVARGVLDIINPP